MAKASKTSVVVGASVAALGVYTLFTYTLRSFKYQIGDNLVLIENPALDVTIIDQKRGFTGNSYRVTSNDWVPEGLWLREDEFMWPQNVVPI